MGAMKEFAMWMEEKGYAEWNDLHDQYDYHRNPSDHALWDEYMLERHNRVSDTEEQALLFDLEEGDICDETATSGVFVDDGQEEDHEWSGPLHTWNPDEWMVTGSDATLPLFDDHGGLTAEAFDLLYELEQDGGFT